MALIAHRTDAVPPNLRLITVQAINGISTGLTNSKCRSAFNKSFNLNLGIIYTKYPQLLEKPNNRASDEQCKEAYHKYHKCGVVFDTPLAIAEKYVKKQDGNLYLTYLFIHLFV